MCLDLLGEFPKEIYAKRLEMRRTSKGIGEAISISLEFPSGTSAEIAISNLLRKKERFFSVGFDNSAITYDGMASSPLIFESPLNKLPMKSCKKVNIKVQKQMPLEVVIGEFCKIIRSNEFNTDELRLGVNVVKVLDGLQAFLEK